MRGSPSNNAQPDAMLVFAGAMPVAALACSLLRLPAMAVRALVVDDSIFVRSIIRRQLERIGCTVVAEAENASQGLSLFRSLKPDLVTLDIVMAEADGIDSLTAFRAIRQEAPEVPVIMMTAMPFDESRETFMRAGAQDYIVKPFNSGAFEQIRRKLAAIFPELNRRDGPAGAAESPSRKSMQ